MAQKNVITVELVAKGNLLEKLEQASSRLRAITSSAAREADRLADHSDRAGHRMASAFSGAERAAGRLTGFLRTAAATAAGFLTANVIGGVFSRATGLASDFADKILDGAKEGAEAQRFLAAAVQETGGSFTDAEAQALSFARAVGISTTAAERLQASARIGLQGTGLDADKFLRSAADLAASRGIGGSELPTIITQIFNGADEGLGKLFAGKNPSTFFNEFARAAGRTADSLTDLERRQILANAVIQAAGQHAGLASQKLGALGGILEQISALVTDLATKIGDALARNQGVLNFVNRVREGLLGLLSSDANFDAFIQKVADGFVSAAGRALDFGATVARVINGAVGLFKKAQIGAEQAFLGVYAFARDVISGIQLLIIDALQLTTSQTQAILGAIQTAISGLLTGVVAKVRSALEGLGPSGRALIPGAETAFQQVNDIGAALQKTQDAVGKAGAAFANASGGLERWKANVTASAVETTELYHKIGDLSKGYAAVDKQTAAANKATDAFFANLKTGLPQFAQFNPRETPTSTQVVTRLIAEGDSLTGFQETVRVQATASNAATNAATASKNTMEVLTTRVDALSAGVAGLEKAIVDGVYASLNVTLQQGLTGEVVPAGGAVP